MLGSLYQSPMYVIFTQLTSFTLTIAFVLIPTATLTRQHQDSYFRSSSFSPSCTPTVVFLGRQVLGSFHARVMKSAIGVDIRELSLPN